MTKLNIRRTIYLIALVFLSSQLTTAQSGATRPRRTLPNQPTTAAPSGEEKMAPPLASTNPAPPSSSNTTAARSGPSAAHAFSLLQQKQNAAALAEARQVATADPSNSEAWKIAGFAQMNLQQYEAAAVDLQRALELQRAAGEEDPNTTEALARAYVRTEKFDLALPLLVAATSRPVAAKTGAGGSQPAAAAQPDPLLLYYRGLAEYQTGKVQQAEQTFNLAVKADPKNALPLYYLGRIAYDRNEIDAAIASLNRATVSDSSLTSAWALLATSYLRRAGAAAMPAKADADYLNAVRAGEGLLKVANDEPAAAFLAQALIGAKQYARAATTLERYAAGANTQGSTLYLLGVAHSRTKAFPKRSPPLSAPARKIPRT
ncbi:MAG: tetratricopeptide repeat protein [Pyrinomonadaceae bacterium]